MLRKLNHPNIVQGLATIVEGDKHYVVMEYIDGGDLRKLLGDYQSRQEFIPLKEVLEIALDLSDALARTHRLNIIHRDIKPSNVLLTAEGIPQLTDFGIARLANLSGMTQVGAVVGTLSYISPEGFMDKVLDNRADIWAFGAMFYELLTLQHPFEKSTVSETISAITLKAPPPLADLRPDLPPAIQQLIDVMLVKDRDQRISSVRWVGAQIDDILIDMERGITTSAIDPIPAPKPVKVKSAPPKTIIVPDLAKGGVKRRTARVTSPPRPRSCGDAPVANAPHAQTTARPVPR
jgi:serine/threonine protein kinase